jgi:hypothetical protein
MITELLIGTDVRGVLLTESIIGKLSKYIKKAQDIVKVALDNTYEDEDNFIIAVNADVIVPMIKNLIYSMTEKMNALKRVTNIEVTVDSDVLNIQGKFDVARDSPRAAAPLIVEIPSNVEKWKQKSMPQQLIGVIIHELGHAMQLSPGRMKDELTSAIGKNLDNAIDYFMHPMEATQWEQTFAIVASSVEPSKLVSLIDKIKSMFLSWMKRDLYKLGYEDEDLEKKEVVYSETSDLFDLVETTNSDQYFVEAFQVIIQLAQSIALGSPKWKGRFVKFLDNIKKNHKKAYAYIKYYKQVDR